MNEGVAIHAIGNLNSFAYYADDVNLLWSSVSGLPSVIDAWRFKFGIKKTKDIIYGNNLHPNPPKWRVGCMLLQLIISLILGVLLH